MKVSQFKDYDELPLFLNAELVAQALGIAPSSSYELMHEDEFPVLKIGTAWWCPRKSSSNGWSRTWSEGSRYEMAYKAHRLAQT